MEKFKENEIKYLAGLLDADGSLSLTHNNGYLGLVLNLELAESCDRDGRFIKSLVAKEGNLYTRKREENWVQTNTWRVTKRSVLEMFIPRVVKHMVIKAKHWNYLLSLFREYQGKQITINEFDLLLEQSKVSRKSSGPLHEKIHPTWAWVTGYLEGDGWFMIRNRPKQVEIQTGAVCQMSDVVSLKLLQKAFGGIIKEDRGHMRWIRNLGPKDASFAKRFCSKLVQHSQLKTHKIEQILSYHSQRLNEITAKAGVIV
jgi:hypothetical protein